MIHIVSNRKKLAVVLVCLGILWLAAAISEAGTVPYVAPAAWSPDGSKVAIVVNSSVEVRDAATTQVLYVLDGHTDLVPMVAWSPDSSMIATPSYDQTVKLWSASDGTLLHTLSGHNAYVTTVVWSPDGTRLFSWGFDTSPNLFVWDVVTGALLSQHNSGTIVAAAFSPDGQRLALSSSLSFGIIDGVSLNPIAQSPRVVCCANQMYSIAWSPDGNTLVTGSINGLVTLWDAHTAQILKQFEANPHYASDARDVDNLALSWIRAVTFGPNGSSILAVSGDGSVREWDSATGTLIQDTRITPLFTAVWSPYGGRLAVWGPTAQNATALSNEQAFDASTGEFTIVVPVSSLERLQAIASACNAPSAIRESLTTGIQADQLTTFVAQLEALPEGTIPPACADDLIAVAQTLQSQ